ncbi:MAG: L,D-transpeptidase family protein, partial [Acidimicrobiales bacterium]
TKPSGPQIRVSDVSPRAGDAKVSGAAPIRVTFSTAVSASTPFPRLSPPEPGKWRTIGRSLVFLPSVPYLPLTQFSLSVPAGASGVLAVDGTRLARPLRAHFETADGSIVRLEQLLSLLQYSPLAVHMVGVPVASSDLAAERTALYVPPQGSFAWREDGWPAQLRSLWLPGKYGVMARGLVMSFQADHGLLPNGRLSPGLWQDLVQAVTSGQHNTGGYNYALGNQSPPQSLTIWHDGVVVLRAPANTGISQSPTPNGNFNVYSRLRRQVMRGTNPGGTKYADPVQYVAYFNGGDAVHYLPRANYGIPQSLGCIELKLQDAAKAWPYLAYGTVVTVIG